MNNFSHFIKTASLEPAPPPEPPKIQPPKLTSAPRVSAVSQPRMMQPSIPSIPNTTTPAINKPQNKLPMAPSISTTLPVANIAAGNPNAFLNQYTQPNKYASYNDVDTTQGAAMTILNQFAKSGYMDPTDPVSATASGEAKNLGYKFKQDDHAQGQDAWDSTAGYLKGSKKKDHSSFDPQKIVGAFGKVGFVTPQQAAANSAQINAAMGVAEPQPPAQAPAQQQQQQGLQDPPPPPPPGPMPLPVQQGIAMHEMQDEQQNPAMMQPGMTVQAFAKEAELDKEAFIGAVGKGLGMGARAFGWGAKSAPRAARGMPGAGSRARQAGQTVRDSFQGAANKAQQATQSAKNMFNRGSKAAPPPRPQGLGYPGAQAAAPGKWWQNQRLREAGGYLAAAGKGSGLGYGAAALGSPLGMAAGTAAALTAKLPFVRRGAGAAWKGLNNKTRNIPSAMANSGPGQVIGRHATKTAPAVLGTAGTVHMFGGDPAATAKDLLANTFNTSQGPFSEWAADHLNTRRNQGLSEMMAQNPNTHNLWQSYLDDDPQSFAAALDSAAKEPGGVGEFAAAASQEMTGIDPEKLKQDAQSGVEVMQSDQFQGLGQQIQQWGEEIGSTFVDITSQPQGALGGIDSFFNSVVGGLGAGDTQIGQYMMGLNPIMKGVMMASLIGLPFAMLGKSKVGMAIAATGLALGAASGAGPMQQAGQWMQNQYDNFTDPAGGDPNTGTQSTEQQADTAEYVNNATNAANTYTNKLPFGVGSVLDNYLPQQM